MPTYRNGYIPESLLVSVGGGWDQYGRYEWLLSPGTKAKHDALLVRNPRLRPSPGYSCYRPYAWQVKYRSIWGDGAARAGTSSHGGFWENQQTLAIDYGNWAYCYGNRDGKDTADKRAAFFADCRAVGLAPNLIRPDRGYPDEPWHVVDLTPWAAPAASDSKPFDTTTADALLEEDMATLVTGGGQNLVIGNHLIPLTSDQVPSIKGAQVLEVHPTTHYNIIQAFQRAGRASEFIVNVIEGGDGTRYLLSGGELKALVDNRTIAQLVAQGVGAIDMSKAEVDNLLKS